MSEDVALFHRGNETVEQVKIRPAYSGGRDTHNGVVGVFDFWIGDGVDADVSRTVPADRLHQVFPPKLHLVDSTLAATPRLVIDLPMRPCIAEEARSIVW